MTYRERPDRRAVAEERLREALERTMNAAVAVATAKRDVALAEARIDKARAMVGATAELMRRLEALERAGTPPDSELELAAQRRARHERELRATETELERARDALRMALGTETAAKQMEAAARAEIDGL